MGRDSTPSSLFLFFSALLTLIRHIYAPDKHSPFSISLACAFRWTPGVRIGSVCDKMLKRDVARTSSERISHSGGDPGYDRRRRRVEGKLDDGAIARD